MASRASVATLAIFASRGGCKNACWGASPNPALWDKMGLLTKWENIICCGRIKEKAGGGLDATEAAHGNDRGSDAAGTLPSEAGGSTGSVFCV